MTVVAGEDIKQYLPSSWAVYPVIKSWCRVLSLKPGCGRGTWVMSNHYGHYGQCDHSPMSGRKSPNYLRPANAQTPLPKVVYIYISTRFCYFFPTLSNPSNHHKAARCSNIFLTVSSLHPFCPGTSFQKLLGFNP